jgi:hypothetical protein
MATLSISRAWEETKTVLARDGGLMTTVALALIVLPGIILAVVGAPTGPQASLFSRVVYIAVVLLGLVTQIALNRLAIGPSVTVKDAIGQGLVRLGSVVAVFVLLIVALVVVTFILAILLGATAELQAGRPPAAIVLVLAALTALAFTILQLIFPVAAVETGNPLRLITRSWQLARSQYLRLLVFVIIVFVGLGIGLIAAEFGIASVIVLFLGQPNAGSMSALLLGVVASALQAAFTVVTAVMLARMYVQLSGGGTAQAGVPRSGI